MNKKEAKEAKEAVAKLIYDPEITQFSDIKQARKTARQLAYERNKLYRSCIPNLQVDIVYFFSHAFP